MRNPKAKVSDPNKFFTSHGSRYHNLYSSKVCPDGTIKLMPAGKEDIQAIINSYKDSTDIAYILSELSRGNTEVLNRGNAMYGDFTDAPKSLAEALQIMIDGEAAFNKLPLDVRQSFDNNFRNWLFTNGSDDWNSKMSKIIEKIEKVDDVINEVNEDVP